MCSYPLIFCTFGLGAVRFLFLFFSLLLLLLPLLLPGGRQDADLYKSIIAHLQAHHGTVLTEHVGNDLTDMGLQSATEKKKKDDVEEEK